MRSPKVPLIAIGAYLALIGVLAVTSTGPAYTQSGQQSGPNVKVINTPAEPVPVREVQSVDRQPVQIQVDIDKGYEVPAGKLLVIEYISGSANTNGTFLGIGITTRLLSDPEEGRHVLPITPYGAGVFGIAEKTLIFASPGTQIGRFESRSGGTFGGFSATLCGYLVDVQ